MIFLLVILLSSNLWAQEIPPTLKQRQDCELHVTRGYLALQSGSDATAIGAAETAFSKALSVWPQCYLALEGQAILREKRGEPRRALELLVALKRLSPDDRWPHLNYHIGRLYLSIKAYDRAELYLNVARSQGVFEAQTSYLLGLLSFQTGQYLQAESDFLRALQAIQQSSKLEDKELEQTVNVYLAECYVRLGLEQDAIVRARAAERGQSATLRKAAWRLHAIENRWQKNYGFGFFHFFDGNAALATKGNATPNDLAQNSSHGFALIWDGKIESTPAKKWGLGAEAVALLKFHLAESLDRFDELRLNPRLWARYGNLQDWQARLGYELNRGGFGRYTYSAFETIQGPYAEFEMQPLHRWAWTAKYHLQLKSYPLDLGPLPFWGAANDRDAVAHVLGFSMASKGPNPVWRPRFDYELTVNQADGVNFRYTGHRIYGGQNIRVLRNTDLHSGLSIESRSYGQSVDNRQDWDFALSLGFKSALYQRFVLSFDANLMRNLSSNRAFRYDRGLFYTGILFRFD